MTPLKILENLNNTIEGKMRLLGIFQTSAALARSASEKTANSLLLDLVQANIEELKRIREDVKALVTE